MKPSLRSDREVFRSWFPRFSLRALLICFTTFNVYLGIYYKLVSPPNGVFVVRPANASGRVWTTTFAKPTYGFEDANSAGYRSIHFFFGPAYHLDRVVRRDYWIRELAPTFLDSTVVRRRLETLFGSDPVEAEATILAD